MDENLKSLKEVEKTLLTKLEKSPLFKQLESLRATISIFEGNGQLNGSSSMQTNGNGSYSEEYDPENFTWKERVLFFVNKLGSPGVADIISGIQSIEPSYTKAFLDKRVGVTVSQLKKSELVGAKKVGKKTKYFIK